MSGHSEEQLKACFDAFDADGSGEISRRELVNALTKIYNGDEEKAKAVAYVSNNLRWLASGYRSCLIIAQYLL